MNEDSCHHVDTQEILFSKIQSSLLISCPGEAPAAQSRTQGLSGATPLNQNGYEKNKDENDNVSKDAKKKNPYWQAQK